MFADVGNLEGNGNAYLLTDLPFGIPVTVMAYSANGCLTEFTIPEPNCDCPSIAPPSIDETEMEYCASFGVPTVNASVGAGLTVDWYDAPIGGQLVASGQTRYTPNGPGIYYAEAVDPQANCRSDVRTSVMLSEIEQPLVSDIEKSCSFDQATYTVVVEVINGDGILPSQGTLEELGNNLYEVSNIPISSTISLAVANQSNGCATQFNITPPECTCPDLPAPSIDQTTISYCANEPIPTLVASSPEGTTVNWYDSPQGGQLLAEFTDIFHPDGPGQYFLQTVSRFGGCVSEQRTGVQLVMNQSQVTVITQSTCVVTDLIDRPSEVFTDMNGCDSTVVFDMVMDIEVETREREEVVCDPQLAGITTEVLTEGGCSVFEIVDRVLEEFQGGDFILSTAEPVCDQSSVIDLDAILPESATNGIWRSLDGAEIMEPDSAFTSAEIFKPGMNRFTWSLSNESCENFSVDTLEIWFGGAVELVGDTLDIELDKAYSGLNVMSNDQYPREYNFFLLDQPNTAPISFIP